MSTCECLDAQTTSYPALWYLCWGLRDDCPHPRRSVRIYGYFAVGSRNATYGGSSRRGWPPAAVKVSFKCRQWRIHLDVSMLGSCQQLWGSDTYSTLATLTGKWTCGSMLVHFINSTSMFLTTVFRNATYFMLFKSKFFWRKSLAIAILEMTMMICCKSLYCHIHLLLSYSAQGVRWHCTAAFLWRNVQDRTRLSGPAREGSFHWLRTFHSTTWPRKRWPGGHSETQEYTMGSGKPYVMLAVTHTLKSVVLNRGTLVLLMVASHSSKKRKWFLTY